MKEDSLFKRMADLGFPLLDVDKKPDVNATLAEMVEAGDLRLLEGFPVVLATGAEKGLFDHNELVRHLKRSDHKALLGSLLAMSLALYDFFGLKFSWVGGLYGSFSAAQKKTTADFTKKLKTGGELNAAGKKLSVERLKTTFKNYFLQKQSNLTEFLAVRDEFGLEYLLSQVFSGKQKELFLKKLKREKLTKTEKEYFSRSVKKKVLALANPELHRLARKLLEL